MLGANSSAYLSPGQLQLSFGYRTLNSEDHYNLDEEQIGRQSLRTYVINRQRLADLGVTYQLNDRWSLSLGAPGAYGSWAIPLPFTPLGPRYQQDARGLADMSLVSRYWVGDPLTHPLGNVSAGLGFKAPTGDYNVREPFPSLAGTNIRQASVDTSIQPGDSGWGIIMELSGFKTWPKTATGAAVTGFASLTYLANPKDTNSTPSILQTLQVAQTPLTRIRRAEVNSVPDSYVFRAGFATPIGHQGLAGLLAFRQEGLPRYDLIGGSHGFRRPGYEKFIEPGLAYSHGRDTFQINVPIAFKRFRELDAYTDTRGDATFPDRIVLFNWSHRFDTKRSRRLKAAAQAVDVKCESCPPGKCVHKPAPGNPARSIVTPPPTFVTPGGRG